MGKKWSNGYKQHGVGSETKGKPSASQSSTDYQFIEYTLTNDDKARLKALVESGDLQAAFVFDRGFDEYKYSSTPDKHGSGFLATFSCSVSEHGNFGKILCSRGASREGATLGLLFRHIYCAKDELWSTLLGSSAPLREEWE